MLGRLLPLQQRGTFAAASVMVPQTQLAGDMALLCSSFSTLRMSTAAERQRSGIGNACTLCGRCPGCFTTVQASSLHAQHDMQGITWVASAAAPSRHKSSCIPCWLAVLSCWAAAFPVSTAADSAGTASQRDISLFEALRLGGPLMLGASFSSYDMPLTHRRSGACLSCARLQHPRWAGAYQHVEWTSRHPPEALKRAGAMDAFMHVMCCTCSTV